MRKKSIIIGLVLLLTGAAAFSWVIVEQRKEKQLQLERHERFKANLDKVDKLVAGETDVHPSADIISDENFEKELDKYKTQKEARELILTVSILCMLTGGSIFSWLLLLWTTRLLIRGSSRLMKFSAEAIRHRREAGDKQLAEGYTEEDENAAEQKQKLHEQQEQPEKPPKVSKKPSWQSFNGNQTGWQKRVPLQTILSMESEPACSHSAKNAEKISVLLSDEKSVEEALEIGTECPQLNTIQTNQLAQNIHKTVLSGSAENSLKLEDSLEAQTESLEEQVGQFRQITGPSFCNKRQDEEPIQTVQQAVIEHSEPLRNSLKELTREVSAIREYALHQQDRMRKLQDGYDWNIIRTFCLRVIRCIDNLENRIERLSKQDIEMVDLEEIRDELIFALESSGVEQFELEIDSDYRGQERYAEAVKDKEHADDAALTGKVARVIRPGYQYVIDDENVKVVRTAQVKLFG